MDPRSSPTLVSGCNEDHTSLTKLSITELISDLRTAFRKADYDRVEEVLFAKETKLKAEIGALDEKLVIERLDRMDAEEKLKECKDQYEKLLEAGKKRDLDDENTIAELRIKNRQLEEEKHRAECVAVSWKRELDKLNERLSRLENGAKLFINGDTHIGEGGKAELETRADPGISVKVEEDKETNEVSVRGRECGKNTAKSSHHAQRNALAALELQTVVEIGDSDDDECISRGTLNGKEATSQIVGEVNDNRRPSLSGPMQQKILPAIGMAERKWVSASSDDDDTSTSSGDSELNDVRLPPSFLRNTIDKRRKT